MFSADILEQILISSSSFFMIHELSQKRSDIKELDASHEAFFDKHYHTARVVSLFHGGSSEAAPHNSSRIRVFFFSSPNGSCFRWSIGG